VTTNTVPHWSIISVDQWMGERTKLLAGEKESTKPSDRAESRFKIQLSKSRKFQLASI
jgi:hypothetical protein